MMKTPVRLLLIDDNPDDRTLARRKLEQELAQLQVYEINDAAQLEQALEPGNFDLVITDYRLRWTDGLSILRKVKNHYPDCPVVMFTGTGNEEVAVEAMKSGLEDYIIKTPNHYTRLAIAVRAALERSMQRQALKEAQSRYQRLFEGVPIGLYRMTPTGQVLEANSALLQILGYDNLQTLLDTGIIEHHFDPEARRFWQHRMETEGMVKDVEMPLYRCECVKGTDDCSQDTARSNRAGDKDKAERPRIWVRHNARAIQDKTGKILYYEGAIEDVTQRKQAEEERQQLLAREQKARAEAEQANRLKDEFLATLSHELRTPLNAILGWTSLLRKQRFNPEKAARALEIIERNAHVQTQLIEDLLDVSRIIRGQLRLNICPVDLNRIIERAIETVQPAADAKGIELESFLDPAIGSVNGDPDRLQQVIWNLLSNAIKFTSPHGRVSISLEWLDNAVQIRVQDTGKGLPANVIPYIFDRFRQAEGSTTRSHGGLGLGLAIVRHLIELHGGTVWCESPGPGMGSTFTAQLPMQSLYWQQEEWETSTSRLETSSSSSTTFALAGRQVVIVDDEPDALEYFRIVLEQEGAQVTTVHSVSEALQAIIASPPDVLMSDIGMPEEDGYSLIARVRALEAQGNKFLPAVALTAYAREQDRERALASGFQLHLAKPVEPDELVAAIVQLTTWQADR